ncbi:hypothetical protein MJH12_00565 [bacterium]|nr:hypothetical protein [bacterium]
MKYFYLLWVLFPSTLLAGGHLKIQELSLKVGVANLNLKQSDILGVTTLLQTPDQRDQMVDLDLYLDKHNCLTKKLTFLRSFEPFIDLASFEGLDRKISFFGLGFQKFFPQGFFGMSDVPFRPYFSLGLGYSKLKWKKSPLAQTVASSFSSEGSFTKTLKLGSLLELNKDWSLDIAYRYDSYQFSTDLETNFTKSVLKDQSASSILIGLRRKF